MTENIKNLEKKFSALSKKAGLAWVVFYKCLVGGFGLLFGFISLFSSIFLIVEKEYGFASGYTLIGVVLLSFGFYVIRFKQFDVKLEHAASKVSSVIAPPLEKFWASIEKTLVNLFIFLFIIIICAPIFWLIYKLALLVGAIPVSIIIGAIIIAAAIKK